LISTTWVLGWYLYTLWMGLCGFIFQIIPSFLDSLNNTDFRTKFYDTTTCHNYIQQWI
jgi:hypothetical protein